MIDGAGAEASRIALLDFITQYRVEHDVEDVYLMGFSQGAIMATVAAATEPAKVQGAVVLSGRFPKEFQPGIVTADELAKTALWVGHGTDDEKLPIHHGRATQALLVAVGAPLTYREYPAGHAITPEMQSDAHRWLTETMGARLRENGVRPA
ncbi:putative esterase [Granulicella aggregans]|uniref:Putative esterase n=1 Tax=Granulicella aggregans TaxID=474949 RepID=A0A7W7ZG50_9BACT|nr:alpha/beta fold hydrolase [Granulicella aggregans]MBB5059310.1 putative esterase [Granulicella aggregans]